MSEKISEELVYTPTVNNHSTIIYRNIAPQGTNSVTLGPALSGPVEFIVNPSCWNPSKSKLNFQINLATSGTKFNFINGNTACALGRIVVYDTATNNLLMDCSNFEKYAQLVIPASTKVEDYLTNALNLSVPGATSGASTPYPVEDLGKYNGGSDNLGYDFLGYTTIDLASNFNAFTGKREWYKAGAGTCVLDVCLPFSALKFSFLSTDKVLYSPSNLLIQCYFNSVDNFLEVSNDPTDPHDATQTSASGTIANISLSLANESNLQIISQIIQKTMSEGVSMAFPYPTCIRQSISSTTSHSYQIQLTKAYGNRVLFIATAPFKPNRGGTFDRDADISKNNFHPRGPLTLYNTFLNGIAIFYPQGFDCTKGEDYKIANKEYIKGSVVQSSGEYIYANWCHYDNWTGTKSLTDLDPLLVDGLDVGAQNSVFQVQATTSVAVGASWVNVIVGQKQMTLSANGIMVQ